VNAHALAAWIDAAEACRGGDWRHPRALALASAKASGVDWLVGVRAASPVARLLPGGPASSREPFLRAAATALGVYLPSVPASDPAPGERWLDAWWEPAAGRWERLELRLGAGRSERTRPLLPAGEERPSRRSAFRAAAFEPPEAAARLADLHALAPVRAVARSAGRPGWTLILEEPLPWPLFLALDASASFTAESAPLSLLMRDARVAALDFDGEALWALCAL
jgi:hypothetical protein